MPGAKAGAMPDPVEIARIALRNLTDGGLPPTPENYVREYCSVGRLAEPAWSAPASAGPDPEMMHQIEGIIARVSETSADLATGVDRFHVDAKPLLAGMALPSSKEACALLLQELARSTSFLQQSVDASRQELADIRGKLDQTKEELRRARELAQTDALTGLANRRYLDEIIVRDIARARRTKEAYSVAILDIDHFKKVNDQYGHAAGDQALVHVASAARNGVRGTDAVYRYGGEEFVILLPGAPANGAFVVVDRLRMRLENAPFDFGGEKITLRFSAGVAELQTGEDAAKLLARADQALYEAKRGGRNRVKLAFVAPPAAQAMPRQVA